MPGSNKYLVKRLKLRAPPAEATTATMVKFQKGLRATVAASPHLNDDPAIAANFAKWTTVTDQLDTTDGEIRLIVPQLVTLRGAEGLQRAQYTAAADLFMATLTSVYLNNPAPVQSMGVQPEAKQFGVHLIMAPLELRVAPIRGQPGRYTVRWHGVEGAGLYDLERSSDPPSEATYALVYSDKYVKFVDSGTIGQVVWYRVRAHGGGVSAWSPPVSFVIR